VHVAVVIYRVAEAAGKGRFLVLAREQNVG
jgi:hypothetical protein